MIYKMRQKLKYATIGMAALALVACGSAEDRAKTYYESGNSYLEQKDYTKAAIEFRNALKLKEDYADAWFGMSKIEENNQNWPRVVGNLSKVLEINPQHPQALENLAKFMLLAGDFPTALKHANAVYALMPDNPSIIALKAAVLLKLNDREGGLGEAKRALQIQPHNPDATILIAADLIEGNQLAPAQAMTDAAILANPGSLGLLLLRIRIAELGGNIADQETSIRAIIKAYPDRQEFKDALASFLIKQGRKEEAEKEYRLTVTGPDDLPGNKRLVSFLRAAYGMDAARQELSQLAKTAKDPFAYQLELAEIEYAEGKKTEALTELRNLAQQYAISEHGIQARISLSQKLLDAREFVELEKVLSEVISNDAKNVAALKIRGAMQLEKGNLDQALNDLREALNFDQTDPSIRLLIANVYERRSSFELAEKELLDAYRNSKGDADVGLGYTSFLLRRGSFDRAEDVLSEVYAASPRNRQVLGLLADLRMRKGDWKGAEELARIAQELSGDTGFAEKILGSALVGQGRFEDAIAHFQLAAKAAPNDVQPMFNLVRAYIAAGKSAEAEAFAKSVLEASPDSANSFIINGAVQLALKRIPEAQRNYETATLKAPAEASSYLALAEFFQTQKETENAIKTLKSGLEKSSKKKDLNMALASVYERAERPTEAIAAYEAVVSEDPGSVVAINNLVSLLTDDTDDPATLQKAAKLATILRDSPIPHFRETLGWALVRQGDVKLGLEILEKSIEQLKAIPAAQYHLGMAYSADGAKSLASKHLKIALDLEKDATSRERIIRALEILGPENNP